MSCVMPEPMFRSGCDAVVGELRQAWSSLDRASKAVETKLAIYGDDTCHSHHGFVSALRTDLITLRRELENIEVEVRQLGSPSRPSPV